MLPQLALAARGCLPASAAVVSSCARSIATSGLAASGAPTYTYTPPGSSVSDPAYANQHGGAAEGGASAQPLPDSKIVRPSKKAQWLRMSTRHARELESQSQQPGAMLPPGCSMSDPTYSIRDPVYFVDKP